MLIVDTHLIETFERLVLRIIIIMTTTEEDAIHSDNEDFKNLILYLLKFNDKHEQYPFTCDILLWFVLRTI